MVNATCRKCPHKVHRMEMKTAISCTILRHTKILIAVGVSILSKTDALDEEKWLNMLGTFVKDWFRYESHFVHGRDSLVDILKERGLLSESDAVQPLIGKKS